MISGEIVLRIEFEDTISDEYMGESEKTFRLKKLLNELQEAYSIDIQNVLFRGIPCQFDENFTDYGRRELCAYTIDELKLQNNGDHSVFNYMGLYENQISTLLLYDKNKLKKTNGPFESVVLFISSHTLKWGFNDNTT